MGPQKNQSLVFAGLVGAFLFGSCQPSPSTHLIESSQQALQASQTPLAVATLGPTVSLTRAFVPGDPTATPPGSDITDPRYLDGQAADEAGDYKQVLTSMQAVLDTNPNLAPAYWYRGRAYFFLGECAMGLIEMEKALEIDQKYALAWADYGLLNQCLGNSEEALIAYDKALSLDPSLAKVHHNLATIYARQGNPLLAIDEYDLALQIDPTRASTWLDRSVTLGSIGSYKFCVGSANKALELDPNMLRAIASRAVCQVGLEEYTAAVADFEFYLVRVTGDAVAWYNLGIAKKNLGDWEGALVAYSEALAIRPDSPEVYINRGEIFILLGEYQKAVEDETMALTFGDISLAYLNRAKAFQKLGDLDSAIADYEAAAALAPAFPAAYEELAQAYFEAKRYEDTINVATLAVSLDPSNNQDQRLQELLGVSYYEVGNFQQALIHINAALETGQYVLGLYERGIIYQALGMKNEAIQDLRLFIVNAAFYSEYREEIEDAEARLEILEE